MDYKKIYELYLDTTGTPKERATAIYSVIHGNPEYGRFADAPLDWLEHKIETGEIDGWGRGADKGREARRCRSR